MLSRSQWIIRLVTRRLWFKAGLYGAAAVGTGLAAVVIAPLVPQEISDLVGADAVKDILNILASSMLAVATFSLGTMVAAFSAATSNATPRASTLLVEDSTSQNVLSTFIGAFIFSLVGVIALSTGFYGPGGRVVLFIVTIIVIAAVLATFFRWIDYLSNLGRLTVTLDKVERATAEAVRSQRRFPHMHCQPLRSVPASASAHCIEQIGYVRYLDVAALQEIAEEAEGYVWVLRLPGTFADSTRRDFCTSWSPDEETLQRLRAAFVIGNTRTFDQDPRFGLIVLSEIASRALSPGINDPGTAIDVIGRMVRVLAIWVSVDKEDEDPKNPRVMAPEISISDLFDDAFDPIARDGAGTFEVGIRLQKALASLARFGPGTFADTAAVHAQRALALSDASLTLDDQKERLHELASYASAQAQPGARDAHSLANPSQAKDAGG